MKHAVSLLVMLACVLSASLRADEFDSGGVKIFYTVQGTGSPVVLIHGLHASAAMNWTLPGITGALANEHRVIAMDARGHGQSDKPQDENAHGTAMVDDVVRLLDHLHVKRARIVGYSMGGMIAMKMAVLHPGRVDTLLLCGMGWLREGGRLQNFWERIPVRERGAGRTSGSACTKGFTQLAVSEAEVKALKMPAAIIVGSRDPVERLYVEPLTKVRPDWPVTKIADAGHLSCITKPEFKDAVVKALHR